METIILLAMGILTSIYRKFTYQREEGFYRVVVCYRCQTVCGIGCGSTSELTYRRIPSLDMSVCQNCASSLMDKSLDLQWAIYKWIPRGLDSGIWIPKEDVAAYQSMVDLFKQSKAKCINGKMLYESTQELIESFREERVRRISVDKSVDDAT